MQSSPADLCGAGRQAHTLFPCRPSLFECAQLAYLRYHEWRLEFVRLFPPLVFGRPRQRQVGGPQLPSDCTCAEARPDGNACACVLLSRNAQPQPPKDEFGSALVRATMEARSPQVSLTAPPRPPLLHLSAIDRLYDLLGAPTYPSSCCVHALLSPDRCTNLMLRLHLDRTRLQPSAPRCPPSSLQPMIPPLMSTGMISSISNALSCTAPVATVRTPRFDPLPYLCTLRWLNAAYWTFLFSSSDAWMSCRLCWAPYSPQPPEPHAPPLVSAA